MHEVILNESRQQNHFRLSGTKRRLEATTGRDLKKNLF